MDETLRKADLENLRTALQGDLRTALQEDIRGTERRLDAKIDEVDERLDAKMDSGFALVGRLIAESEDRLLRHTDMRFESVQENIRKLADGVLASNERLARHIQHSEAEHRRLQAMTLAGDAALDKRVTALESRRRRA